jgi:CHAD domain-containing protein
MPKNVEEEGSLTTENDSLLIGAPALSPNPPSYDSISQSHDVITNPSLRESRHDQKYCVAALFLSVGLVTLFSFSQFSLTTINEGEASYSQLLVLPAPELVFAPDVADTSTTLSELAQSMLPSWYLKTVSETPIFTPTVMPADVYETRKIMLKTRDLMDVFSPVYPNNTGGTDMWKSTRNQLKLGYMIVGEFQDLHNAHVMYSQQQLVDYRGRVLDWKRNFEEFRRTHSDVPDFLAAPTLESFHHEESRLFWKTLDTRATGADPATPWLQFLAFKQLERALRYLRHAYPYESVLNENAHEHYHNLRKELRSLTDEFELFEWVMVPTTPETSSAIEVLKRARKLLGDINDDWTAYSIYVDNNEYYSEQERLAKGINDAWASFKVWVEESDFEGAIQCLAQSMNHTIPGKH